MNYFTILKRRNPQGYDELMDLFDKIWGLHILQGEKEIICLLKAYYNFRAETPDFKIEPEIVIKEFSKVFSLVKGRILSGNKGGRPPGGRPNSTNKIISLLKVSPFTAQFYYNCELIEKIYPKRTIYTALNRLLKK